MTDLTPRKAITMTTSVPAPELTLSNDALTPLFEGQRLMAILRGFGPERSLVLARQAWSLGIDCVELPIQSERDLDALAVVVAAGAELGKTVGAGTVTTLEHVEQARNAGAAFVVSPGYDPAVVQAAFDLGLPSLPGVATASEVQAALASGLTWLKAFPASVFGPTWFSAMAGPFPGAKFVATGGMDASNAALYLGAGARIVAVGSALGDAAQLPLLAKIISPS
jgi:Entner-Doudoroff aldolase